jgi:BlaI family transcriptional regulator, penicillinase repressor
MKKPIHSVLSRREREIMDIIYKKGSAHVGEVQEGLSGNISYSATRALLRVLEEKGHLRHEEKDLRYVYLPTAPRDTVRKFALRHLVDTFFEGSTGKMMASLIGDESTRFSADELDELARLIRQARKEGRP